jgi:hypothetical protein
MGGVETGPSLREIKVVQNRLEELLLELIHERLAASAPDANALGADSDEPTEYGKGYLEGYWDAIQRLSDIIDEQRDNNLYRLPR